MAGKYSAATQVFTCEGFKEALDAATEDTIKDVQAAIKSALNKVAKSLRTLVSSEIRKVYNVPKKVLDERLDIFEARIQNLEVVLTVGGKSVSLSYFGARQFSGNRLITRVNNGPSKGMTKVATRKRAYAFQGIEVEVFRGRKTQMRKQWFKRFSSGHLGILKRIGKGREYKTGFLVASAVSIASMFSRVDVNDAVVRKIDEDLERIFWHELEFYLNRGAR